MTSSADLLAILLDDAPEAYPTPPPQRWDPRGVRIVRRSIGGDDAADGDEQFHSAHQALRTWHRWRNADATSVPSTSLKPGASRVDSGGGKAPQIGGRLTAKLYARSVEPSVRAACAAGYVTTDGRVRLEPREVAIVVVGILDGLSSQQIADDLNAARASTGEHTVTTIHVGRSRVRAWMLVEESLVARDLLPRPAPRPKKITEETATMAAPGFDLDGWKEIEAYCGKTRVTLDKYASDSGDPLPVHHDIGGRVIAKRAKIDEWRSRQVRPRHAR